MSFITLHKTACTFVHIFAHMQSVCDKNGSGQVDSSLNIWLYSSHTKLLMINSSCLLKTWASASVRLNRYRGNSRLQNYWPFLSSYNQKGDNVKNGKTIVIRIGQGGVFQLSTSLVVVQRCGVRLCSAKWGHKCGAQKNAVNTKYLHCRGPPKIIRKKLFKSRIIDVTMYVNK